MRTAILPRPPRLHDRDVHVARFPAPRRPPCRRGRLALLSLLACAARAALPPGVTQGASVEGITEYTLANGLRVLLFPDATKPTTTVNVTYLVGSRQENYGETGMAHLLEHMLFKGTPSISEHLPGASGAAACG